MSGWRWVDPAVVRVLHEEQLAEHGGRAGIRDPGLLESALERPRNRVSYEVETDAASLAASYAYGIARNHPFFDGNKRAALIVSELFLALNGWSLATDDADCVTTFLALASGEMTEDALAGWFRSRLQTAGI